MNRFATLRRKSALLLLDLLIVATWLLSLVMLGEGAGFWSPGTALVAAGAFALGVSALMKSVRHAWAGTLAVSFGVLSAALGSTGGLGLKMAVAGVVVMVAALFWRLVLVMIELASGA
jgi:hypothetical protein